MRNPKFIIIVLFLLLISKISSAATPEYSKPINAYQKKYDMQFFVWKPIGLESKWYATYDGYLVTEIARNQWVYGVAGNAGQLTESIIAVGSVDPNTIYILTPLPSFLNESLLNKEDKAADSLRDIFDTKCDNFSITYTNASLTPIAWESGSLKVFMWSGKKWVPISSRHGEKLSDTIKRDPNNVAGMLRNNKIKWTQFDTLELANYVRSAGYTWIDDFESNMPFAFREVYAGGVGGGGGNTGKSSGGTGSGGDGGWDTGRN